MTLTTTHNDASTLFDADDLIFSYSRAQAILDGILVDVSEMAQEAGFRLPVAMTLAAWEDLVAWNDDNLGLQDETGRLWDVLWMARHACRSAQAVASSRIEGSVLRVPNMRRATKPHLAGFVVYCGPGDTAEPVITIMLPGED